jgi:predicted nucleic acid-binding protein
MILIDTNILARYFLNDIPDHSARTRGIFQRAASGHEQLFVPVTCIAEITWLTIKQRRVPKEVIADLLLDLFLLDGIVVENRSVVFSALEALKTYNGLSFVDCYHLALAGELGMNKIYSFDKKMDRYPGVERMEPE